MSNSTIPLAVTIFALIGIAAAFSLAAGLAYLFLHKKTKKSGYVIQFSGEYVGNCMVFWRENGRGYTTHLDEVGVYTRAEADKIHAHRETDVPRKLSDVCKAASLQVDVQRFREDG